MGAGGDVLGGNTYLYPQNQAGRQEAHKSQASLGYILSYKSAWAVQQEDTLSVNKQVAHQLDFLYSDFLPDNAVMKGWGSSDYSGET